MRKLTKDSNRSRIAARARTAKTLEKYYGKLALHESWLGIDKQYVSKLLNEATKLHARLVVKGVL